MASLVDLVKSRREGGQSVSGSLSESLKEKFKEKFDPRNLINQEGIMPALFPGLKSYKAKMGSGAELNKSSAKAVNLSLNSADINTKIYARNSLVLPELHRDFNLMRQNIAKLVKLEGGSPRIKTDRFFLRAKHRAAAYQAQIDEGKAKKPEKIETKKKKSGWDLFLIASAILAVGAAVTYGLKKLTDSLSEIVLDGMSSFGKKLFDGLVDMFDWSKLSMTEIGNMGKKVLDMFTGDDNVFSELFTDDVVKKLQRAGEGILTVATGSTAAEASVPPISETNRSSNNIPLDKDTSENQKKVYDSFINAGFSKKQSLALTAEVGRENGYQSKYLYGTHYDPYNKALNVGVLSFQGDRAKRVISFMQQEGVADSKGNIQQSQKALDVQAKFIKMEMSGDANYARTKKEFLENPDIERNKAAEVLGRNFIRWRYDDPKYSENGKNAINSFYNKIESEANSNGPGPLAGKQNVNKNPVAVETLKNPAAPIINSSENVIREDNKPIVQVVSVLQNVPVIDNSKKSNNNQVEGNDYFNNLFVGLAH